MCNDVTNEEDSVEERSADAETDCNWVHAFASHQVFARVGLVSVSNREEEADAEREEKRERKDEVVGPVKLQILHFYALITVYPTRIVSTFEVS